MAVGEHAGRLGVVGAGTMGHSIAQLGAMNGYETALCDVAEDALEVAREKVGGSLEKLLSKDRITQEQHDGALERLTYTTDMQVAAGDAGIVVEAVPEILGLKQEIFEQLESVSKPDTLLASNTSQLSITAIGERVRRTERVIGLHFFNPPVLMRLVEIIRGLRTSDDVLSRAVAFVENLGKESVVCQRDTPGFITTRAIMALRLECIRIHEEGIASIEDIDKALRLAFNHPMGQFELNDMNGLDVALHGARNLRDAYGERFAPPPSLVSRVTANDLGRKTGRGWYDYAE